MVLTLIGIAAERKRFHVGFQANTIRHRRVLSLFQLGTLSASAPPKISQLDLNDALESFKTMKLLNNFRVTMSVAPSPAPRATPLTTYLCRGGL